MDTSGFIKSCGRIIPLAALSLLLVPGKSRAQTVPIDRTHFVFHVYVDPIHGDNAFAYNPSNPSQWYNPRGVTAGSPRALQNHPYGSSGIQGFLQHAPYSFKTVQRALEYINGEFPVLPWQNPVTKMWVDYIVIHCMPGLYGPLYDKDGNYSPLDPRSGLKYNGDMTDQNGNITSLEIPPRVSIQGTSALDTIFDDREHKFIKKDSNGRIVAAPINIFTIVAKEGHTRRWTFIDSVQIRGARSNKDDQKLNGAGIYIGMESEVHCTISNCFITNNTIGIAIDQDGDVNQGRHHCIIANNTIAWNRCGIWSGNSHQGGPGQNHWGYALPMVVNNILDSGDPYGKFPASKVVPFLGLHPDDLTVVQDKNGPLNPGVDFNAYEMQLARTNNVEPPPITVPGWPQTCPRHATSTPLGYSPRVDLASYTKAGTGNPRGSLYLNDILRNCPLAPVSQRDLSPHDFRLAPMVGSNPGSAPTTLNPLVNMGIGPDLCPITFQNDTSKNIIDPHWTTNGNGEPPGLPQVAGDVAIFQAWDWDGEGFGNPRVTQRSPFSGGNPDYIDIGADEMGELVMGGYIFGTRVFSRSVPGASSIRNERIYLFNVYSANNQYPRPFCNQVLGRQDSGSWWDYTQRTISALMNPVGNYTKGRSGSARYIYVVSYGLPFFMDNLECDVSPHLLLDPHPYWAQTFTGFGGNTDYFASNPWCNYPVTAIADNPYLYYYVDFNVSPPVQRVVADGTINPPGTFLLYDPNGYLMGTPQQFGPIGFTGSSQYSVNSWGWGDASSGGPDYLPNTNWLGMRFNCQVNAGTGAPYSNLQTWLCVEGTGALGAKSSAYTPPSTRFSKPATLEEVLKAEEKAKDWIRKRFRIRWKKK